MPVGWEVSRGEVSSTGILLKKRQLSAAQATTILTSAPTRQDCELSSRLGGHSDTYTCHIYGVGCVGIVTTPREHLDLGHSVCALDVCGVKNISVCNDSLHPVCLCSSLSLQLLYMLCMWNGLCLNRDSCTRTSGLGPYRCVHWRCVV